MANYKPLLKRMKMETMLKEYPLKLGIMTHLTMDIMQTLRLKSLNTEPEVEEDGEVPAGITHTTTQKQVQNY